MPSTGECASSPIGSARSSGVVVELGDVGHELARDRIVRIGAVDQRGNLRRDRDRIARGDAREVGELLRRREAGRDQFRWEGGSSCAAL